MDFPRIHQWAFLTSDFLLGLAKETPGEDPAGGEGREFGLLLTIKLSNVLMI